VDQEVAAVRVEAPALERVQVDQEVAAAREALDLVERALAAGRAESAVLEAGLVPEVAGVGLGEEPAAV
jgi:hypothetical protein